MRGGYLLVGMAALTFSLATPLACGIPFSAPLNGSGSSTSGIGGNQGSTTSASSSGGMSMTTTSSSGSGGEGGGGEGGSGSSSGSSGGGPACKSSPECGKSTMCVSYECKDNQCQKHVLLSRGPTPSQLYGDCQSTVCDSAEQLKTVALPEDIYDDGNECTVDACENGMPMNKAKAVKEPCEKEKMCDGLGHCVECVDDADCKNTSTFFCGLGKCQPNTCKNGKLDLATPTSEAEADVDCGGPCKPCSNGDQCTKATDCQSYACQGNACAPPTCKDGVKNGEESDIDCGGALCVQVQQTCTDGQRCLRPSDCKSGVCAHGLCQKPTCTDAVKNGAEEGIDCGPACSSACVNEG